MIYLVFAITLYIVPTAGRRLRSMPAAKNKRLGGQEQCLDAQDHGMDESNRVDGVQAYAMQKG